MWSGSFRMPAKATDSLRIVPLPLFWLPSISSKLKPHATFLLLKKLLCVLVYINHKISIKEHLIYLLFRV
jgi:hypothetical protein